MLNSKLLVKIFCKMLKFKNILALICRSYFSGHAILHLESTLCRYHGELDEILLSVISSFGSLFCNDNLVTIPSLFDITHPIKNLMLRFIPPCTTSAEGIPAVDLPRSKMAGFLVSTVVFGAVS
jgi:hypothetical protein